MMIKNIKKIIILISFSLVLTITPIISYGTCGFIVNSSPPDFGELELGEESDESFISLTKTGDEWGSLSFTSTSWRNADNTNIMPRGATHYSFFENIQYENMISVNSINLDVKTLKLNNNPVFMYLIVAVEWLLPIINSGGFFGEVTQEFVFTMECITQ